MKDRYARSCYGHLAGIVGIHMLQEMLQRGWIAKIAGDGERECYEVTPLGLTELNALGIDATLRPATKRLYAYGCVDRTEKVHHIGGFLGEQILNTFLERGWLTRPSNDRVLALTESGKRECNLFFTVAQSM